MKIKSIIYQKNTKRIHGSWDSIDLRLMQHDYLYEEEEGKKDEK